MPLLYHAQTFGKCWFQTGYTHSVPGQLQTRMLLAFVILLSFSYLKIDGCPQSSLTSPSMGIYSCPESIITYTCVLNSSAGTVITAWSGSAFQCSNSTTPNQIALIQRLSGNILSFNTIFCGILSAVTTMATPPCYTSVLTIPAVQALNGATVVCGDGGSTVGNDALRIITTPGPVGDMTVTSTSVDQLTVTWTPPTTGGVPTRYNVTINDSSSPVVIADNGSPVYTHTFTGLINDTLYTVSVVAINCAGASIQTSLTKKTLSYSCVTTNIINYITSMTYVSMAPNDVIAIINCSFLNNQSFYCVVCCSTDPSVPPDSSVYNISTTRGTEVNVTLQGLTSGQMFYCKAAATNTNSNNCAGPVVGGVKVFFSFMTSFVPKITTSSPSISSSDASIDTSTAVGISVAMTFILSFFLGGLVMAIIVCGCYIPRRFPSLTTKSSEATPSAPSATYEPVSSSKKAINTIELESNSAYGTGRQL